MDEKSESSVSYDSRAFAAEGTDACFGLEGIKVVNPAREKWIRGEITDTEYLASVGLKPEDFPEGIVNN